MSKDLQILTKQGILADVPPGRRVRIDPELRASSARTSPVPVGNSSFPTTGNPPLAPDEVTCNTGFQVTDIVDDITSAYFGCFYVQNITDHTADLEWEATSYLTKQLDQNPNQTTDSLGQPLHVPIQTDVGTLGEDGGSAEGVHPRTIQGTAILSNSIGVAGTTRLVTPGAPVIEECNNKIIILEDRDVALTLPQMGAEQDGLQVSIKNRSGDAAVITATGATIDYNGVPPENADNTFTFEDPAFAGPSSVVLLYRHDTPQGNWLAKAHYHWQPPQAE